MTLRYAWPQFRRPLELTLNVNEPTGVRPGQKDEQTTRRIRLDDIPTWSTARFEITLSTTETPADGIGDLEAYVLVSSPRSNTRIPVSLQRSSQTAFSGNVEIDRGSLAGPVEVTGNIAAYGDWGVRVAGASEPWHLIVDTSDAPTPPGAPPFEITWIEFDASDALPILREAHSSHALMDTSGPKPILYLNRSLTGFEPILMAARPREEKKRLRNLLAAHIANYATVTLFEEALRRCDITDDVVTEPEDRILAQVLDAVANQIPNVVDTDELVLELRSTGTQQHVRRAAVDDAISALTNLSDQVARSVEDVFRG